MPKGKGTYGSKIGRPIKTGPKKSSLPKKKRKTYIIKKKNKPTKTKAKSKKVSVRKATKITAKSQATLNANVRGLQGKKKRKYVKKGTRILKNVGTKVGQKRTKRKVRRVFSK